MPQMTRLNGSDKCHPSIDQNLALCGALCLDHLLEPHRVCLIVRHRILLNLAHILLDLWLRLLEETRPKQFDNGLIEEFQSLSAIGLVEYLEVDRPKLSLVRRNETANRWHHTFSPHDTVRVDHYQQRHLVRYWISDWLWKFEGACKQQTLLLEGLKPNLLILVRLEGLLFEEATEHAEKWSPDEVALVTCYIEQACEFRTVFTWLHGLDL